MSIHFSNFAVHKETTFSPPETRIIGKHMRIDLNQVSTEALKAASHGLSEVSADLREALGDERFSNEFYVKLIALENIFGNEWMRREKEAEGC